MTSDGNWQPCEAGAIQDMVDREQQAQKKSAVTRRSVLAGAAVSAAGLFVLLSRNLTQAAALTCGQVRSLAAAYVSGTLSTDQIQQVDAHRKKCSHCDQHLTKLEARSV